MILSQQISIGISARKQKAWQCDTILNFWFQSPYGTAGGGWNDTLVAKSVSSVGAEHQRIVGAWEGLSIEYTSGQSPPLDPRSRS